MKYILVVVFAIFADVAMAQQIVGPFIVHGQTPYGISSRPDAGIAVQAPVLSGDDQQHSVITIDLNTCDPLAEGVLNFSGRDENGAWKQMGTVSTMWSGGCAISNGYAVIRLNSAAPNSSSDIAYRQWYGRGVGLFREGDNDHCGGRFLCITRTNSFPSIAGKTDLVLEANMGGPPDRVLINSYNAGDVVTVLAGGNLGVGTYSFGQGSSGVIAMKNGSCPLYSAQGTGTLCVDSGGSLRFVGQNGTTTILGKP